MHPLVEQLTSAVTRSRLAEQAGAERLDAFWAEVAGLGTPLLEDVDDRTRATFLFREHLDHGRSARSYTQVWLSWDDGPVHDLQLLPRTDVWWAEIELPDNFTGVYAFHCADKGGTICEDVHEPWPMTFADAYARPGSETVHPDEAYGAYVVSTKTRAEAPPGTVSTFDVPAGLLPLPARVWHDAAGAHRDPHPETFPVWCYEPAGLPAEPAPVVILMAGQFLDAMDLAGALDRGIDGGTMPPAIVVAPGNFRGGHKAWGWRNGFGPDELSEFFGRALLPALRDRFPIDDSVHLVAWNYTTPSAIETARRLPQARSVILLDPSIDGVRAPLRTVSYGAPGGAPARVVERHWSIGAAFREVAAARPRLAVALGVPPRRGGDFAWQYYHGAEARAAAVESGLPVVGFEVTDGNVVAAGEAIGAGVGAAIALSARASEQREP